MPFHTLEIQIAVEEDRTIRDEMDIMQEIAKDVSERDEVYSCAVPINTELRFKEGEIDEQR